MLSFQGIHRRILSVISFYREGFAGMVLGRKLWAIVLIKLFVLFVIVKWLFFPDLLKERFDNDAQRSDYVLRQLTRGGSK